MQRCLINVGANLPQQISEFGINYISRPGRPQEIVTPENFEKIRQTVLGARKVKQSELVKHIASSKERVGHIINKFSQN